MMNVGYQVFDNIRRNNPAQLTKLEVLEGDITKPGLGLSPQATDRLKEVSVIFHTAATVKFDEELKLSVMMNVLAPVKVMELADRMPKLEVSWDSILCKKIFDRPGNESS